MTNYFEAWGVVKPHIFTSQSILFSRQGTLNKKQNKLINLKVANFCIAVFRMRKKRKKKKYFNHESVFNWYIGLQNVENSKDFDCK